MVLRLYNCTWLLCKNLFPTVKTQTLSHLPLLFMLQRNHLWRISLRATNTSKENWKLLPTTTKNALQSKKVLGTEVEQKLNISARQHKRTARHLDADDDHQTGPALFHESNRGATTTFQLMEGTRTFKPNEHQQMVTVCIAVSFFFRQTSCQIFFCTIVF